MVKHVSHVLPTRIITPDVEGIELYSMPRSHEEMDSLPHRNFDSTLTVGILPSQRAGHPKDDLIEIVYKTLQNLSKSLGISCSQSFVGERINQPNLGFH